MDAEPSDMAGDAIEIARLAAMDDLAFDRERDAAAERLGIRGETLDRQVAAARRAGRPRAQTNKPQIVLRAGALDQLATEGEGALIASRLPIFQRGESLVRPTFYDVFASDGRRTIAAGVREITAPALVDRLSRAAEWVRPMKRGDFGAADPPAMVASIILDRSGEWTFPSLAGVITTPTLRPDGTVLLEAGYDESTRFYHVPDPHLKLPPIPERPTIDDARRALALLDGLLENFPFVGPVDKAVALSMLLTPILRGAMAVAPLHAARASTAGTGKSFLADLAAAIATGQICPVSNVSHNPEETEKGLTGLILAGHPIVALDNVTGELGGSLLCQATERPLMRLRPLGTSDHITIENRATFFATGNNFRVRGDMTRRAVITDLDARMERPELRRFSFDPVKIVLAARGVYVVAALTIARAYLLGGVPVGCGTVN